MASSVVRLSSRKTGSPRRPENGDRSCLATEKTEPPRGLAALLKGTPNSGEQGQVHLAGPQRGHVVVFVPLQDHHDDFLPRRVLNRRQTLGGEGLDGRTLYRVSGPSPEILLLFC